MAQAASFTEVNPPPDPAFQKSSKMKHFPIKGKEINLESEFQLVINHKNKRPRSQNSNKMIMQSKMSRKSHISGNTANVETIEPAKLSEAQHRVYIKGL
jgi:hypothetical protein